MANKYMLNLNSASLTNSEVIYKSTETPSINLALAPKADAFDDHIGGVIDTTKWAAIGTVTEQLYPLTTGKPCLDITGPATEAWDIAGVIYKPQVVPTVGTTIFGKFIVNNSSAFAVGLQEYDFTGAPGGYTLKLTTSPQAVNNSTYVVFKAGQIQIVRGGTVAGEILTISDSCWRTAIYNAEVVNPLIVSFLFTTTGYQIYVNQLGVWSAPRLIHTEVRASGTQPANGYSFCVNKLQPVTDLGFYDLSLAFKTNTTVTGTYFYVPATTTILKANTFVASLTSGGIIGTNGSVLVQFPNYNASWYTTSQLLASSIELTGRYAHEVRLKLSDDILFKHGTTIEDK